MSLRNLAHKIFRKFFYKLVYKNVNKTFKNANKNYFLITSHGQTATFWMAHVLNKHQEVFCSHGYNYPPEPCESTSRTLEQQRAIGKITQQRFFGLRLKDFFEEIQSVTQSNFIGNVHAFTLSRVNSLFKWVPLNHYNNLKIVNAIRHPITQIGSAYKCWGGPSIDDTASLATSFINWDFQNRAGHIIDAICFEHKIDKNFPPFQKFVVTLLQQEDIIKDIITAEKGQCLQVQYEKITTDPDCFSTVLNFLTDNKISISDEYLQSVFDTEKLNRHREHHHHLQAAEEYQSWEPWQKTGFKFLMDSMDFNTVYKKYQYDFSFV